MAIVFGVARMYFTRKNWEKKIENQYEDLKLEMEKREEQVNKGKKKREEQDYEGGSSSDDLDAIVGEVVEISEEEDTDIMKYMPRMDDAKNSLPEFNVGNCLFQAANLYHMPTSLDRDVRQEDKAELQVHALICEYFKLIMQLAFFGMAYK